MHISVIIPTFNRSKTLILTLNSLFQQNDLDDFEIIIVDNGSTDDTKQVCTSFTSKVKPEIRYFYDAEPGLLTGRHLGASLAKGDVFCFLDDDVELSPSWIFGVKDAFNNPKVFLATGPCLPKYEVEPPSWFKYFWSKVGGQGIACSWLSLIDLGNKKRVIDTNLVWGLNFCIRKNTFISLGGFHPDNIPANLQMFQGDGETGLTLKARQKRFTALYHPKIKLHHIVAAERLTIEYFEKRAFYQGICNSFTLIRKKNLDYGEKEKLTINDKIKRLLQPVKDLILELNKYLIPKEVVKIKNLLLIKENSGFVFHQTAFKNNPKVKEWVMKKNYWDYKLPL